MTNTGEIVYVKVGREVTGIRFRGSSGSNHGSECVQNAFQRCPQEQHDYYRRNRPAQDFYQGDRKLLPANIRSSVHTIPPPMHVDVAKTTSIKPAAPFGDDLPVAALVAQSVQGAPMLGTHGYKSNLPVAYRITEHEQGPAIVPDAV